MTRIITYLLLLIGSFSFGQNKHSYNTDKTKIAKRVAKTFLRRNNIPGMSITVMQQGRTIWSVGFGYAKYKPKERVLPNKTQFRIASISKSITGLTLAKLMDDNSIDLNKSIYYYLPNYPKKTYDFTVAELGGHLAGIRGYKNDEYSLNKKMSIEEGLELFKNDPLIFKPSTQFLYNSFGYVLLSEIMQKVSNKNFYNLVDDAVFKPLNMSRTVLDSLDIETPHKTHFFKTKQILSKPVANEYKVAGGGFLSTSEDIAKLGNEIISQKIVSKESISKITTTQYLLNGDETGYGIGFSIGKTKHNTPKFYHTGGGVGASSILLIYPEEELVICVLTNLTGISMDAFGTELETVFIH